MKRTMGRGKGHSHRLCDVTASDVQGKKESRRITVRRPGDSQVRIPRSKPKEKLCLYSPDVDGSGGAAFRGLGSSSPFRGGRSFFRGGGAASAVIDAGNS